MPSKTTKTNIHPKTTVKEFVQRHRIVTVPLQKKFDITQITHFVNGKVNSVTINSKFTHNCNVYYIKNKKAFNDYRKKNHYNDIVANEKIISWKIPEKIDLTRIIFGYDDGGVLFDYQGNPIPYLHSFNYIGTPFHNEVLDLEKAIKILKKHKDVKQVSKILQIEYYNATDSRDKYIYVDILPSPDVYKKFYKKTIRKRKKGTRNEFWSCRLEEMVHDGFEPDRNNNYLGLYPDAMKK